MANKNLKAKRLQERQNDVKAVQSQREEFERRMRIDAHLVGSASAVYGALVAKAWDGDEAVIPQEVLQKAAGIARASIQAFGEALGMLPTVSVVETPVETPVEEVGLEVPASEVVEVVAEEPIELVQEPVAVDLEVPASEVGEVLGEVVPVSNEEMP